MLKLCIKLKHKVYANSLQAAHRLTMANYEDKSTYPKKKKRRSIPQVPCQSNAEGIGLAWDLNKNLLSSEKTLKSRKTGSYGT